jgi:hypothetical protein
MKSLFALALALPIFSAAQVAAPNADGVSMGHLHLNARDVDAQARFWTAVAGARPAKLGTLDVLVLPGVIVFINRKDPSGGSYGSVMIGDQPCGIEGPRFEGNPGQGGSGQNQDPEQQ